MKEIPSKPEDFNIYCTAADSMEHSYLVVREDTLLRQIKLCSFLGKYVFVSCSHIYENRHTQTLLVKNPDLLYLGIVAVGLRSDCRDFSDLLAQRRANGCKEQAPDAALTEFLDRHTSVVIRWTPMDMQPHFKARILDALQNPDSLLRQRLTAIASSRIAELSKRIADLPEKDATRTTMHRLALDYLPHRTKAFMREVNLLYYVMGSADKFLRPHLSPLLFADLDRGCKASLRAYHGSPYDEWLDILFREALLPMQLFDRLTIEQLTRIREDCSEVLNRFRNKFWRLTNQGDSGVLASTGQEIVDRLVAEVKKEQKRLAVYDTTARCISVSSLILSAFSLVPHPALAALSFLVSGAAFAASSEKVKHGLLKTGFSALTSTIVQRARKEFTKPAI